MKQRHHEIEKEKGGRRALYALTGLAKGVARGIGSLLGFAAEMERQGKSEHIEQGEITGKTRSGKEYRGAYGFRAKIGLNPEDFSVQDGSAPGGKGQKRLPDGRQPE
jgi:hypothetical protein